MLLKGRNIKLVGSSHSTMFFNLVFRSNAVINSCDSSDIYLKYLEYVFKYFTINQDKTFFYQTNWLITGASLVLCLLAIQNQTIFRMWMPVCYLLLRHIIYVKNFTKLFLSSDSTSWYKQCLNIWKASYFYFAKQQGNFET